MGLDALPSPSFVVAEDEVALGGGEAVEAAVQAGEARVFRAGGVGHVHQGRTLALARPQHLPKHVVGDAREVSPGVRRPDVGAVEEAARHPVHGLVGQLLGMPAPAPGEQADEAGPDRQVARRGPVTVRVDAPEQGLEPGPRQSAGWHGEDGRL